MSKIFNFIQGVFFPKFDELHMAILLMTALAVVIFYEPARLTVIDYTVLLATEAGWQGWLVLAIIAAIFVALVRAVWRTSPASVNDKSMVAYTYYGVQGLMGVSVAMPAFQMLLAEGDPTIVQRINAGITLAYVIIYAIRFLVTIIGGKMHSDKFDTFLAERMLDTQYTKKTLVAVTILAFATAYMVMRMGAVNSLHLIFLSTIYTILLVRLLMTMRIPLFSPAIAEPQAATPTQPQVPSHSSVDAVRNQYQQ